MQEVDRIQDILLCIQKLGRWKYENKPTLRSNEGTLSNSRRLDRKRMECLGRDYGRPEEDATEYAVWLRNNPDFVCAYCGERFALLSNLRQADHVAPLSKGGAHRVRNIVPACRPCNYSKRAKTDFELPVVSSHLRPDAWRDGYVEPIEDVKANNKAAKKKPENLPSSVDWDDEWFDAWCRENS